MSDAITKKQVAVVMAIVTTVASAVWIASEVKYNDLAEDLDTQREDWRRREEVHLTALEKCQEQLLRILVPPEFIVPQRSIPNIETPTGALESVGDVLFPFLGGESETESETESDGRGPTP